MGHTRPRFNKAREEQLQARREGKKKARVQDEQPENAGDAEIIIPRTAAEKAKAREQREIQEQAASQGKMSSKKRKRMDNYVEKKLQKDRRTELFKSLAASQETMQNPLQLRPSSTLGSKQFHTNQEKLDRVTTLGDRKRQRVFDIVANKKKGYHSDDEEGSSDDVDGDAAEDTPPEAGPSGERTETIHKREAVSASNLPAPNGAEVSADKDTAAPSTSIPKTSSAPVTVGSGLAGGVVPVVVQRRPKQQYIRKMGKLIKPQDFPSSDSEDSFDSSDSEFDTDPEKSGNGASDEDEEGNGQEDGSSAEESDAEHKLEDEEEWGGIKDDGDDAPGLESEGLEDDETESAGANSTTTREPGQRQRGSFKDWARHQLGLADSRTEEGEPLVSNAPAGVVPRKPSGRTSASMRGPLGEELVLPTNTLIDLPSAHTSANERNGANGSALPAAKKRQPVIAVQRSEEVQEKRLQLPILAEEDTIMEAIRLHSVVVLCGETGSGKTTQVPQFLYEAGFGGPGSDNPGMIGITQPRRVAAMSMATRVGEELSLPPSRVSYQIRYDATTSPTTAIKFMTDGVLLRELANDFLLSRYSVVIVDEAHERSVNTDVLIGTLSRVVRLREDMWREGKQGVKPLRLIIMSATLRVTDFTENTSLFKSPPPLINVAARQHPVTMHFNRKTRPDYLDEAYKKVSKIHARLPGGGVLVFLTGQNEITTLCKRLEKRFGAQAVGERMARRERIAMGSKSWRKGKEEPEGGDTAVAIGEDAKVAAISSKQGDVEAEEVDLGYEPRDLAGDVDDGIEAEEPIEDPDALDSDEEYEDDPDALFADREEESDVPMHILPLYSLLPTDKQMRVFRAPPEGHRLVVIATNVAETSLTIPNIKYVVDCGLAKERNYDTASGIQSFDVSWISKASASQRAGRAGRTGPGHCYRLYSSNIFETQFAQHTAPEILRMPIEGIMLQMKSMNIDQVINFPFPTPPDRAALQKAEKILVNLGALTAPVVSGNRTTSPARITELGNAMSLFPLSPRFSKMLVVGQQHGCLPYIIAVVSALSVGDPFLRPESLGFGGDDDDKAGQGHDAENGAELEHIRSEEVKARELRKVQRRSFFAVQQQHAALGKASSDIFKMLSVVGAYEYDGGSVKFCEKSYVRAKAMQEIHKLRAQISRIVQSNFPGLDAGFDPKLRPPNDTQLKVIRQLLTAAFIDQVAIRKDLVAPSEGDSSKYASTRGVAYRAIGVDEDVFIHPSSILFHSSPPECVVYQELVRTSRVFIRAVTRISTAWLPTLGKPLCTFSRVLEAAPGENPASASAGAVATTKTAADGSAQERVCFVVPKFADFEMLKLAPIKATQKRVGSRWVFV